MAVLRVARSNREIALHGKLTTIGRDPACAIVTESPMVSGLHAIILNTKAGYSVEDLDSLNGTFVNGQRIYGRVSLTSGDRIDFVGLSLIFEGDAPQTPLPDPRLNRPTESFRLPVGGSTIRLADLMAAHPVPELASLELDGDLRLAVKPEAKLRAVLEISRSLSHSLELRVVLPLILDSLFAIFPQADCGLILLRNQNTGELTPSAVKFRQEPCTESLPISRGIIQQVLHAARAILSADAVSDARFNSRDSIRT